MPIPATEMRYLARLEELLARAGGLPGRLGAEEITEFITLYRFAATALARVREAGDDPGLERRLNAAVARGHAAIYLKHSNALRRPLRILLVEFPRRLRANASPLALSTGVFAGMGLAGFAAVAFDPAIAYVLLDPRQVEHQIQLLKSPEPFQGNFTFSKEDASLVGPMIASNNIRVSIIAFVAGIGVLPTLLILGFNGMMVGVFFGIAWNHGRLFDMYNLLMCHGTLELSAIVFSGAAGMRVGLAVIAPGNLPRRDAISAAAADAGSIIFGVIVTLLIAACIEAFVTPFTPPVPRLLIGLITGLFYSIFLISAGRREKAVERPSNQ